MLKVEEIKSLIDNDAASMKKAIAKVGVSYYEGNHDINKYRIFFINAEGKIEEDKFKSNIKISHPFFRELVDQEVQYMLSGTDGFVKSDLPKLQKELDAYFNDNEDFTAELYDVLTGCVSKGWEYMFAYKNKDGKTAFQCADSIGVVEVRAKETDDGCEYVIYCYVDKIGKENKLIKRILVMDSKQTYFYCQEDDGNIIPDNCFEVSKGKFTNVRPHVVFTKEGDEKVYYEDFGFIPFFRLDNCKKQFSGLKHIKALIDDYDLMSCGLSNNIQDANEVMYVVKGFDGDNLDELHFNVRNKKLIGVDDDGGVEIKTIDIPYEARQAKLELDEKNIYRFGFGLNTAGLKDTAATTSIAIKSAYSLLDLKCNKLEIRLKQFMRKLLKVVLKEINEENGTDYQQSDVYFNFEREIPVNEQESAQIELTDAQRKQTEINTLLLLAPHLDNETLMELVFEQLDLNYDDYKDKLPDPEEEAKETEETQTILDGIETDPEPDGGDVIE